MRCDARPLKTSPLQIDKLDSFEFEKAKNFSKNNIFGILNLEYLAE